jgi:hypothetical protein
MHFGDRGGKPKLKILTQGFDGMLDIDGRDGV